MRITTALGALALLLGSGVSSYGAQLTSAGLPTTTNTSGACYLRNVGTRPVPVELTALLNFTPGFITPTFENCNAVPLAPGRTCVLLVADLPDDVTFACTAEVAGGTRNLRGSIEVRTNTQVGPRVALAEELR